ncbi:hypothetical protein BDB00DRAFT_867219 [Zychaea mexicana]|uniref:uncharacterized protein n=1 Tax=Zychaea mexicana TaxID=64656 RepID=UPI0022FDC211|nr:uncharacterized protein BDB00DRAFT_867219 [Zychaea mexicana]KAI9498586.1 hypothetical protein BDB00DRAFT_867219 [Zychaea mexicana]
MNNPDNARRSPMQVYIPRHRRVAQQQSPEPTTTPSGSRVNDSTNNENEQFRSARTSDTPSPHEVVVRRGRGQFRAPVSANSSSITNDVNQQRNWREWSTSGSSSNNSPTTTTPPIPNNWSSSPGNRPIPLKKSNSDNDNNQRQNLSSSDWMSMINKNDQPDGSNDGNKNSCSVDRLVTDLEKLDVASTRNNESSSSSSSSDGKENESSKEEWEELLETLDKEDKVKPSKKTNDPPLTPEKRSPSMANLQSPNEYTNILDCYDFPSFFKTYHLQSIFSKFENAQGGFKIKWMDDTRALIIFVHPHTAKRAFLDNLENSQIKLRPYTGGIEFSESPQGQPIPRRPATSDVVARRLVHGALGVRGPARTPEQRQAEHRREAKRRMEADRARAISDAFDE